MPRLPLWPPTRRSNLDAATVRARSSRSSRPPIAVLPMPQRAPT